MARVHVDGGDARVLHVRNERDAGGPEARVFFRALHLLAELFGEFAVDDGNMDADFFKDAAVHDRHFAAA